MNWWEVLLITIGISLDLFAALECEGALTADVKTKTLFGHTCLIAVMQMCALFFGHFLAKLVYTRQSTEKRLIVVLVVLILAGIGAGMIKKAVRNERITEHRVEHLDWKRVIKVSVHTSFYTIFIGVAFAFTQTSLMLILLMIAAVTIAVVILGIYTGYHFGYEQKTKAYAIGGALLFAAAIDVVLKAIIAG